MSNEPDARIVTLLEFQKVLDASDRAEANQRLPAVRRILADLGLARVVAMKLPPIQGGAVFHGDPFDHLFDRMFGILCRSTVRDWINQGIGILKDPSSAVSTREARSTRRTSSKRVFIVHGRDEALKLQLKGFLERLDLEPVILHEQANQGRTIIEKFEQESGDAGFAFILLTPDDVGALAQDSPDHLKPRARQNVIFEHGFFVGALGRNRVCAIMAGSVEKPSDVDGLLYEPIGAGASVDSIALRLALELKKAGYNIDLNRLAQA